MLRLYFFRAPHIAANLGSNLDSQKKIRDCLIRCETVPLIQVIVPFASLAFDGYGVISRQFL